MTPFLLLPGHMCDARLWSGVRVAGPAVDADMTRDDRVEAMARRILQLAPTRFVAVGFSMGGIVALQLAALAPERLVGLVLADTNAGPDLPERAAARLAQQAAVRGGRLRAVVAEELKPHYLAPANRDRRDILDLTMSMALDLGADVFVQQSEALRTRPDMRASLAAIRCPTLVVCGAEDPLCPPAWHVEMAAAIPDAALRVVEGAGHLVPLERPEEFSSALGGWAREALREPAC